MHEQGGFLQRPTRATVLTNSMCRQGNDAHTQSGTHTHTVRKILLHCVSATIETICPLAIRRQCLRRSSAETKRSRVTTAAACSMQQEPTGARAVAQCCADGQSSRGASLNSVTARAGAKTRNIFLFSFKNTVALLVQVCLHGLGRKLRVKADPKDISRSLH